MSAKRPFSIEMLEEIVATDSKGRYSFNEDHSLIRANQGHSVDVDVEVEERLPPGTLFHGTAEKFLDSIMDWGLVPKNRLYVHLSEDEATAIKAGRRHGKPAALVVNAREMRYSGDAFHLSKSGVWPTKCVSPESLSTLPHHA